MKHRIFYCVLSIMIITSLLFSNAALGTPSVNSQANPQNLHNIALCYHGFTTNPADKSEYVSYLEDFKEQINHLKNKGYTFVPPSRYNQWYSKKFTSTAPMAAIIFDDARASVSMAAGWLVENKIPFGVAIIGSRHRAISPEDGYLSWASLKSLCDTGFCEILSHTYNMHHFNLIQEESVVVSAPILEGPCYIDNGDFVYIDSDDPRWYWDLTYVDDTTWGFPLFGTDLHTGEPITSTIQFRAKENITINIMRVWAALHSPYSSGYDAAVKISINGTEVANTTISPTQYETRSQWPEREFVTIDFDRAFSLVANQTYTVTLTTQNTGSAFFNIYAIPNFTGNFELTTTCSGQSYGAQEKWPAMACVILAGDNGREASIEEFKNYVLADLSMNSDAISKYLAASWGAITTGFQEDDYLECLVLGGTYSDGNLAETSIKFTPAQSFIGEALRFKTVSHLGSWYPLVIDVYINGKKVSRFSPNWRDWTWQTINISPFQFNQGEEYNITFQTANKSPAGNGLVRIYADQQDLPWPAWDQDNNTWLKPEDTSFQYVAQYEVNCPEGTDVYPSGITIDYLDYTWEYSPPYTGPGKAFLEVLSCTPGASLSPTQICYPFGSYYSQVTGNKEDLSPDLKNIFKQIGLESGMAVWDEAARSLEIVQSEYSEYIIPRYLVLGNLEQSQILQDIDALIGSLSSGR